MSTEKYTCRCGNKVVTLDSYFIDGIRVTICENCAIEYGLDKKENVVKIEYSKVESSSSDERFYHMIDTREK